MYVTAALFLSSPACRLPSRVCAGPDNSDVPADLQVRPHALHDGHRPHPPGVRHVSGRACWEFKRSWSSPRQFYFNGLLALLLLVCGVIQVIIYASKAVAALCGSAAACVAAVVGHTRGHVELVPRLNSLLTT